MECCTVSRGLCGWGCWRRVDSSWQGEVRWDERREKVLGWAQLKRLCGLQAYPRHRCGAGDWGRYKSAHSRNEDFNWFWQRHDNLFGSPVTITAYLKAYGRCARAFQGMTHGPITYTWVTDVFTRTLVYSCALLAHVGVKEVKGTATSHHECITQDVATFDDKCHIIGHVIS